MFHHTPPIRDSICALFASELLVRKQMYQILALTCLISAYSLSVLYLDEKKKKNG
jgi:hypothetical protein